MKSKLLLLLLAVSPLAKAQSRVFSFNEVSTRNVNSEWIPQSNSKVRTAQFTDDRIEVKLDRFYDLDIVSTTHLPDRGVVYVCRDQQKAPVTVMLISDQKMFVYDDRNRYLVKLLPRKVLRERLYARVDR